MTSSFSMTTYKMHHRPTTKEEVVLDPEWLLFRSRLQLTESSHVQSSPQLDYDCA
jgi:hypothetical protein